MVLHMFEKAHSYNRWVDPLQPASIYPILCHKSSFGWYEWPEQGAKSPCGWVWFQIQGGRWGLSSPYHGWALITVLNTLHSLSTSISHTPTNQHHKLDSVVFLFLFQLFLWLRSHQVGCDQLGWLQQATQPEKVDKRGCVTHLRKQFLTLTIEPTPWVEFDDRGSVVVTIKSTWVSQPV